MLESEGYTVDAYTNGEDALRSMGLTMGLAEDLYLRNCSVNNIRHLINIYKI